jgi:hypothetical protein
MALLHRLPALQAVPLRLQFTRRHIRNPALLHRLPALQAVPLRLQFTRRHIRNPALLHRLPALQASAFPRHRCCTAWCVEKRLAPRCTAAMPL